MHLTSSLVTMEIAFMILIGVMAIMTVEITVMKMDVSVLFLLGSVISAK